ncbi:MAG: putative nitrogen fixation protein NifT [Ectothiorhodospiraceae bacterium]|nr:putative nitrogen fixation protein NifT [Ectothiorhodospiraceae bacterium]
MANIMIRKGETGDLVFYLPKKDLEEAILSLEFNSPERWGGELKLADGQSYYIEPLDAEPKLPISLRAKRM